MDAYDAAIHVRVVRIRASVSGEPSSLLSTSKGVRSVGNVCCWADSGMGTSAGAGDLGDSGREIAPVGRRYSARWVYIEGWINCPTDENETNERRTAIKTQRTANPRREK